MLSFEKNTRGTQEKIKKQLSPTAVPAMSNQSRLQFYLECPNMPIQFAPPTPQQIAESFAQLAREDEKLNVGFTYASSKEASDLPDFAGLLPKDEVVWVEIAKHLPADKREGAQARVLPRLSSLSPMEKYILYTYVPKLIGITVLPPALPSVSHYHQGENRIIMSENKFLSDTLGAAYALFHELGHAMDSLAKTDLEQKELNCVNVPAYLTVSSSSTFSQEFYDALCTDYKAYRDHYHNVIVPDKSNPPRDEDIAPLLQNLIIRRVYYDNIVTNRSTAEMIEHIQDICSRPIPEQQLYLRELRTVENFKRSADLPPAADPPAADSAVDPPAASADPPAASADPPGSGSFFSGFGFTAAADGFSLPESVHNSSSSTPGLDSNPFMAALMPDASRGASTSNTQQSFGKLAEHTDSDINPEESGMGKSHQDHSLEHNEPDAPPSLKWTQGVQDIFSYFIFQLKDAGMRFSVFHREEHWDIGPEKVTQEAFAHFFQAHSNQVELNYLREFLPNAYKVYNKMIVEMTRGTIRKYGKFQQTSPGSPHS